MFIECLNKRQSETLQWSSLRVYCGSLPYYKNSHKELYVLGATLTRYCLQAMYLSVTLSQLITFQMALR